MAELGLFGIALPGDLGGAGMDTLAYALVMEELARGYASIADQCGLVELIATLLHRHGTEAQRARYLGPTLRAERRCAYAITEAEAGSDVAAIRTSAERTADGWRLSGAKLWIHNAPVCDFAVVLARTDKAAGHRGMSIFLVDRDRPGFVVGPKEHKMGQRASQVGALTFDRRRAARGCAARRGGARLPHHDERARQGPDRHRRARRRHRAGGARGGARLRPHAPAVRPADRRVPGRPVAARRHGQGHHRRAPAGPGRRAPVRRRRARDHGLLDGQMLRERRRGRRRPPTRSRSSAAAATSAASRSSGCTATPRSPRSTRAPTRSSGRSSPASCCAALK